VKENRAEALAALRQGEVIAFPTETLYGLGADALSAPAVDKVFQLKGRDATNPIPVLVADRAMLSRLIAHVPAAAEKLISAFWPGPLTIVLPARSDVPKPLVNSSGGIGVRISSQPIANELVRTLGRPLTATSANPSGQPAARTVEEARKYFSGAIDIFIDGGELTSNTGSTVVEILDDRIRIIRQGDVSRSALESCVGAEKILL
jgi:L-threonylcarbamoyladenylate synthase